MEISLTYHNKLKLVSLGKDRIIAIGAIGLGVGAAVAIVYHINSKRNTNYAEEGIKRLYRSNYLFLFHLFLF